MGLQVIGAAVLSTIKGNANFFEIVETLIRSVTWPPGFEILSQNIAFVLWLS